MDITLTIEYRKVRHIRLEYGFAGLKVVVPEGFAGDVSEVLQKHSRWISKRRQQIEQAQQNVARLAVTRRTDQTLRILIRNLLTESEIILGAKPLEVKYRKMRSRWGSCSSKKVITFNTQLKYLPEHLIAFVVHHEVLHLKIMRHGPKFWQVMADRFPGYKQLRKELNMYGLFLTK